MRCVTVLAWSLLLAGCRVQGEVLTRAADVPDGSVAPRALGISIGERHGCAIANGDLSCWGNNDLGQLGTGDNVQQLRPRLIAADHAFDMVTTGVDHSCALDVLGQVLCWGGNDRGQLGQGDRVARSTPALVNLPARATFIATKYAHSCALLIDATLYCWGQNWEGQLGRADQPPSSDETAADGLRPVVVGGANWRSVDTGDGHTCAIRLDGGLYCWGRNSEHELGTESRIQVREPIPVTSDGPWLRVSAGQNQTCAVRDDQSLWCWGQNLGSSTGDGYPLGVSGTDQLQAPTRVGVASDWAEVQTHMFHSCALNRSAQLWCWGRNIEGQLGTGDLVAREVPTSIDQGISMVSVGRFATCAVTNQGEPRCTGENAEGQLGTGDLDRRRAFARIELPGR